MELKSVCPVCNESFIIKEFTIKWITESPNVVACCSNECAVNSMGTIIKPVMPKTEKEIKQLKEFNDFAQNLGKSRFRKIVYKIKKLWKKNK